MPETLPTRGQLERTLSQRIQALYRNLLGHRLDAIVCQLFDHRIVFTLENSITQPEQLLVSNGKEELAEELHTNLSEAIQPQIRELVEEVVGVSVTDLLSDATLETGRTGMIVILSELPQLRDRPPGKSDDSQRNGGNGNEDA